MKNITKIKSDLKKKGFSIIEKFYPLKKCYLIKQKLKKNFKTKNKKK